MFSSFLFLVIESLIALRLPKYSSEPSGICDSYDIVHNRSRALTGFNSTCTYLSTRLQRVNEIFIWLTNSVMIYFCDFNPDNRYSTATFAVSTYPCFMICMSMFKSVNKVFININNRICLLTQQFFQNFQ